MFNRALRQVVGATNKIILRRANQQKRDLTTAPFDTYEGGKKVLKDAVPKAWGLGLLVVIGAPFWIHYTDQTDKKIYVFSEESRPKYLHVRNKPFMWECYQCSLFDRDCHRRCKQENAEKKAAWERIQREKAMHKHH
jgi:hypothetical protein